MCHFCNVPRVNLTRVKLMYESQFGPHIC